MKKDGIQTRRRKSKKSKSPKKHLTAQKHNLSEINYNSIQISQNFVEDKRNNNIFNILVEKNNSDILN